MRSPARPFAIAAIVIALAAATLSAKPAAADDDPREKDALAAYARGDYKVALDIFARLFADTHHATYLRNIGRCYQALGDPDRAIASFREHLIQAKGIPPEKRQEVEGFIAQMEALKAKQQAERRPPENTPPPAVSPPAAAPTPGPAIALTQRPAPPPPAPMPVRRKVAIAAAAAGVAGGVVGTIFGLAARSAYQDADPFCNANNICTQEGIGHRDSAFSRALVSTIALAAGAAGIGAGVGLWLTTPATSEPGARAGLGAGATWTASF